MGSEESNTPLFDKTVAETASTPDKEDAQSSGPTLDYVKMYPVKAVDHSTIENDDGGLIVTGGYTDFIANVVGKTTFIVDSILWQDGVVDPEKGANGVTVEAMVDAVIARLRAYQQTRFKCRENALAITDLESAGNWMRRRREDRMKRGVLNQHVV